MKLEIETEDLVKRIRESIQNGSRSAASIARDLGVTDHVLKKTGIDVYEMMRESGVEPLLRGRPRKSVDEFIPRIEQIITEAGTWISSNKIARALGISFPMLKVYGINTDDICKRLGFPRKSFQGLRSQDGYDYILQGHLAVYREAIKKSGKSVTVNSLAALIGVPSRTVHSLGIDPVSIHAEFGIEYDDLGKDRPDLDLIKESLREYILRKNRYVTSMEFSSESGFSKSSVFRAVGSVEDFNRELGFDRGNMGFEGHVLDVISEVFPDTKIERQKTFPDLVYKKALRFDFWLSEYGLLVEADGPQHDLTEVDSEHHFYSPEVSIRDSLKDKYALENGIPLIRVKWSLNFNKTVFLSLLSGIPLKRSVGQPAAKPLDEVGSETTEKQQ